MSCQRGAVAVGSYGWLAHQQGASTMRSMRVRTGTPARAGCMSLVADRRLGNAVNY